MNDWRSAMVVALSLAVSGVIGSSAGAKAWRLVDNSSTDVANVVGGANPVRNPPALHLTSESRTPSDSSDGSMIIVSGITAQVQNANRSWSLNRPNAKTLRFELHSGDVWVEEQPSNKGVERSEVALAPLYEAGTDINISYRFMIEPGPANTATWMVVSQFHQTGPPGPPPFAVEMLGEHLGLVVRHQLPGQAVAKHGIYRDASPIVRGQYYAIDIHVRFGNQNDGVLSVRRDGIRIADYHGAIGFGAGQAYYWKAGVYRAASAEPIAVVYQDLTTDIAFR
jgi:Polysaccharide lyase